MGMFDTFKDRKRNRITQCKAFGNTLTVYKNGDKVYSAPSSKRLYYVMTEIPFRFIEIFDSTFVGIVDVQEVDISDYSVFNYRGEETTVNMDMLYAFSELWNYYISKNDRLPIPFEELYNYEILGRKV